MLRKPIGSNCLLEKSSGFESVEKIYVTLCDVIFTNPTHFQLDVADCESFNDKKFKFN